MAATASIVSQAVHSALINLTTKGGEDYWTVNASQTVIRKTGGGSLIGVTAFNFDTYSSGTWDNGYTAVGWTGAGNAASTTTTTDGTPSDVTATDACIYHVNFLGCGIEITVPMTVGDRTVEIDIAWLIYHASKLPIGIRVTSPSAGVLLDTNLTALASIEVSEQKLIELDLTAETTETFTIIFYSALTVEFNDNVFHVIKSVWLSDVTGGGISIPVAMNQLRNQGIS